MTPTNRKIVKAALGELSPEAADIVQHILIENGKLLWKLAKERHIVNCLKQRLTDIEILGE